MNDKKNELNKNSTVAISSEISTELEQFCNSANLSKKDFIPMALTYFKAQGVNPLKHESPKVEIEKVTKRLDQFFAFFKKQETEMIRPLYVDMNSKMNTLEKRIAGLEELLKASHNKLTQAMAEADRVERTLFANLASDIGKRIADARDEQKKDMVIINRQLTNILEGVNDVKEKQNKGFFK